MDHKQPQGIVVVDDDDDGEVLPIIPHPQSPEAAVLRQKQLDSAKKMQEREKQNRNNNHKSKPDHGQDKTNHPDDISEMGQSSSASVQSYVDRYMPVRKNKTPVWDHQLFHAMENWLLCCEPCHRMAAVADAFDNTSQCTPAEYLLDEEDLLYDSEPEDDDDEPEDEDDDFYNAEKNEEEEMTTILSCSRNTAMPC